MRHVPARSAGIADVVAQQALPRRGDIALGLLPGSDDIARGFLRWRGDMHRVRRPGAQIQRQTPCIPSVGLDPIAGTLGNHRRYDYAVHPFAAQITMQPESAFNTSRFIGSGVLLRRRRQLKGLFLRNFPSACIAALRITRRLTP
jgi:hypothetical protein